ncbi:hypothetical protein EV401DRAFT_2008790 [Pisolithus croceorrhizus]|nr:hypothetical protein EV401DRAFT_2008790 [Pisolithus croceorrhizus]
MPVSHMLIVPFRVVQVAARSTTVRFVTADHLSAIGASAMTALSIVCSRSSPRQPNCACFRQLLLWRCFRELSSAGSQNHPV